MLEHLSRICKLALERRYAGRGCIDKVTKVAFYYGFNDAVNFINSWAKADKVFPCENKDVLVKDENNHYDIAFRHNGKWITRLDKVTHWRRIDCNENIDCNNDIKESDLLYLNNPCSRYCHFDCRLAGDEKCKYTIPRGEYASSISQEDADRMAMDDMCSNSESYFKVHGKCVIQE